MIRIGKHIFAALAATITALFLSGCINPFDDLLFQQLDDASVPQLSLNSPTELSYYGSVILISGRAIDNGAQNPTVSWSISGTEYRGDAQLDSSGSFAVEVPTRNESGVQIIDGPHYVEVRAVDWAGNSSDARVMILRSPDNSDISSFAVESENGAVMLSWDAVPAAEDYVIYNVRDGETVQAGSSPYLWDELDNGKLYTFQLQARIPDAVGDDSWSALKDAVPLSPRTLAPRVSDRGYRSVSIEWRPIDAAEEYLVEGRELGGVWTLAKITPDTTFTDRNCADNTWYEYRVRPVGISGPASESISAVPGYFPRDNVDIRSSVDIGNPSRALAYHQGYVYSVPADGASADAVISIVDAADTSALRRIGEIAANDDDLPLGLAVSSGAEGDFLAVSVLSTGDHFGLQFFSLSDPSAPAFHAEKVFLNYSDTIPLVAYGDTIFAAVDGPFQTDNDLIIVYNLHSAVPDHLVLENFVSSAVKNLMIAGDRLYILSDDSMRVYSLSNPLAPSLLGSYAGSGFLGQAAVHESGMVYLIRSIGGGDTVLDIIDMSAPASPAVVRKDIAALNISSSYIRFMDIAGDMLITAGDPGLRLFDVSDPDAVRLTGMNGDWYSALTQSGTVFLASDDNGVAAADLSRTNDSPAIAGQVSFSDGWALELGSGFAYVAARGNGLKIIDVRDPEYPVLAATYDAGYMVGDVTVDGSHAYISSVWESRTEILDISDPYNPRHVAYYNTGNQLIGVEKSGSVFFASGGNGISLVNIDDVDSPYMQAEHPLVPGYSARHMWIDGDILLANASYTSIAGVFRLDISDLDDPILTAYTGVANGSAFEIAGYGELIFSSHAGQGLRILEYSAPASITDTGAFGSYSDVYAVRPNGEFLYVGGDNFLSIASLSNDPAEPAELGTLSGFGTTITDLRIAGEYAFASTDDGFMVIRLSGE
jgi:hypothetical protein